MTASKEEIEHFLRTTPLSKYQRIQLPHGLEVPGRDHSKKIAAIFPPDLTGKSVLDVGCYYGLYAHEACQRGAARVVGVELDPVRAAAAHGIAELIGDGVEIVQGDIMSVELVGKFDLVFFLSVLHHVEDPIAVMSRLANLCSGTVVVEFCLPTHYLRRNWHPEEVHGGNAGLKFKLLTAYRRALFRLIGESTGLVVTGDLFGEEDQIYHYTYFFNRHSFRTIFQVQQGLFSRIDFLPSPQKAYRMLAYCHVQPA